MTTAELWRRYVQAHEALVQSRLSMHPFREALVEQVRAALSNPGWESAAALSYVPFLNEYAVEVLNALVAISLSVHGTTIRARETIATLPREAAVSAVERAEKSVTAAEDYEAWACLFQLWSSLGHAERARTLATRASLHEDEDVRDVGNAFLVAAS